MCHFSNSKLGLSNLISTLDTRKNCSVLLGRGILKTLGVDAMEEGLLEVHIIKVVNNLFAVIPDDAFGLHSLQAIVSGLGILTHNHDL